MNGSSPESQRQRVGGGHESIKKVAVSQSSPNKTRKHAHYTCASRPWNLALMLRRFAEAERCHRFTAERVGDHAIPSTICGLQAKHGITFCRKWVKVPNRHGTETRVTLYWQDGKSVDRGQLIAGVRAEVGT